MLVITGSLYLSGEFLNLNYEKGTVQDFFNSMIAKIGENLILNDLIIKQNKTSNYSFYIHNSYRKNIGKIISLVEYSSTDNNSEIETRGIIDHGFIKSIYFRDPNGYVIELTYPTEKLNINSYETNMKILKGWQDQKFIP